MSAKRLLIVISSFGNFTHVDSSAQDINGCKMSINKIFSNLLLNYNSQDSIVSKIRSKRIAPLLATIEEIYQKHGAVNIIDIGGTETYWGIVPLEYLTDRHVSITIVNLPGSIELQNNGPFKFAIGNGCNLIDFGDNSFHLAHSNSVVEHVGDWEQMVMFAKEIARVAPKYFVQTPNYWFPVEPHAMTPFFHWLPKPTRIWLVANFQLGHWRKANSLDDAIRIVSGAVQGSTCLDRKNFFIAQVIRCRHEINLPSPRRL
jgi:hypothetical protein